MAAGSRSARDAVKRRWYATAEVLLKVVAVAGISIIAVAAWRLQQQAVMEHQERLERALATRTYGAILINLNDLEAACALVGAIARDDPQERTAVYLATLGTRVTSIASSLSFLDPEPVVDVTPAEEYPLARRRTGSLRLPLKGAAGLLGELLQMAPLLWHSEGYTLAYKNGSLHLQGDDGQVLFVSSGLGKRVDTHACWSRWMGAEPIPARALFDNIYRLADEIGEGADDILRQTVTKHPILVDRYLELRLKSKAGGKF